MKRVTQIPRSYLTFTTLAILVLPSSALAGESSEAPKPKTIVKPVVITVQATPSENFLTQYILAKTRNVDLASVLAEPTAQNHVASVLSNITKRLAASLEQPAWKHDHIPVSLPI